MPEPPSDQPDAGVNEPGPVSAVPSTAEVRDAVLLGASEWQTYEPAAPPPPTQRRVLLPLALFFATCLSTYWVGTLEFAPEKLAAVKDSQLAQREPWQNGLLYMAGVMSILLAHEMGHFLQTVRHKIVSSWPVFIPLPFPPLGTMGAVIFMQGMKADRRQLFDIGISGPIAGLFVAVPLAVYGMTTSPAVDARTIAPNQMASHFAVQFPLLFQLLKDALRPELNQPYQTMILDPFLMAGWVGMLITGLNMLPVSQLDGGHVIYSLFRRRAHIIARAFLVVAIAYVVFSDAHIWTLMLILVILIGADHPPTADDRAPLGPVRWAIGIASLAIPILCFPPQGIIMPR
jgi:Zn-dependent protease